MHTFKHFKQEFYAPTLEERDNFDSWTQKGSLSMEQRASAEYKKVLKNYQEPDMDTGIRKDLDNFITAVRNV